MVTTDISIKYDRDYVYVIPLLSKAHFPNSPLIYMNLN